MMAVAHDWFAVGQAFGLFCVGLLAAWNAYQAKRADKVRDAMAKTVEVVHQLTNSQRGLTLKALAEVTAAKAAITFGTAGGVADKAAADLAMKEYLEHVGKQAAVDAVK